VATLSRSEFIDRVTQALDDLPPFFHAKMNTVEISVEVAPTSEDYRRPGERPSGVLLGCIRIFR